KSVHIRFDLHREPALVAAAKAACSVSCARQPPTGNMSLHLNQQRIDGNQTAWWVGATELLCKPLRVDLPRTDSMVASSTKMRSELCLSPYRRASGPIPGRGMHQLLPKRGLC